MPGMILAGHERNVGFLIHDSARLMRVLFDQRVKDVGLTRSQWWVLLHLLRGDGVTQSELAQELDLGTPSLGTLLDRLEEKGWVERRSDANDRRAKRVHHTEKARPVMVFMTEVGSKLTKQALAGLSADEQRHLIEMLIRIKANLLAMSAGASPQSAKSNPRS